MNKIIKIIGSLALIIAFINKEGASYKQKLIVIKKHLNSWS